jgi:ABC-type transport system involved in multi-copper enzyme maturation permease subunit
LNLRPVFERELRAQARRPSTYGWRAAAVLLMGLWCVWVWADLGASWRGGSTYLQQLHPVVLAAVWLLAPLATADCIARERREKTLDLLRLTPLRAWEIVWAKGLANGLRALTFLLAILPLLVLPMLSGGVAWREVVFSCAVLLTSLICSLNIGLVASTQHESAAMSAAIALLFSICTLFLYACGLWLGLALASLFLPGYTWQGCLACLKRDAFDTGMSVAFQPAAAAGETILRSGRLAPFVALIIFQLCLSLLLVLAGTRLAAWLVGKEPPPRKEQTKKPKGWLQRWLEMDVQVELLPRLWLNAYRARNPVGWLEHRAPAGTLAAGIAFGVGALLAPCLLVLDGWEADLDWLAWPLVLGLVFTASLSFMRDRQTGLLELLVVSPWTARQIIHARLRGLWLLWLPAVGLLGGLLVGQMWAKGSEGRDPARFLIPVFFCGVPVVGLYSSLRVRDLLPALGCTVLAALVLPWALSDAAIKTLTLLVQSGTIRGTSAWFSELRQGPGGSPSVSIEHLRLLMQAILLLVVSAICYGRLHRLLVTRSWLEAPNP